MSEAAADLRKPRIQSTVWLMFWIVAAAWACFTLATSWPYVGLMPQWLLLLAATGILFRVFDLLWTRRTQRRISGWKRFGVRVGAFLLGAFAAASLWQVLDGTSMGRFERAFAPLVEQVHANAAAPCVKYPVDPGLAAYFAESGGPRSPANLHFDRQRFVLALGGWSMDIDGSTLFYDSRTRAWRKVHNDLLAATGEFEALKKDLEICRIELR